MNEEEIVEQKKESFVTNFTTVTIFSRVLTYILFLSLPFVGFFLGIRYQMLVAENQILPIQMYENIEQTKSATESKVENEEKTETIQEFLTKGMILRATGTVREVIQDGGGADLGDSSIPPLQILITLDTSPVGNEIQLVRILDEGCVYEGVYPGDRVMVTGEIVEINQNFGIILTCHKDAHVERLGKEYTNSIYNFSTVMPNDWTIEEKDTLGGFTFSSKDTSCVMVGGNLGFGLAGEEDLVTATEEVVTLRSGQVFEVQVTRDETGEAVYAKPVDFPTGDGILIKNGYANNECKVTTLQILSAFYFN